MLALAFPLLVLGLITLAVLALVNGRREPDPSGRRPYAAYLVVVTFVALFTTVFALARAASSGTRAALNAPLGECTAGPGSISCTSGSGGFSQHSGASSVAGGGPEPAVARPVVPNLAVPGSAAEPSDAAQPGAGAPSTTAVPPPTTVVRPLPTPAPPPGFVLRGGPEDGRSERTREAVQAGFVALAAFLILAFHARRLRELLAEPGFGDSPAKRPYLLYLYTTCFVSVITTLASGSLAAYALVRVIAPGLMTSGAPSPERDEGIVELVSHGFLFTAAALIFAFHWKQTRSWAGSVPAKSSPAETTP